MALYDIFSINWQLWTVIDVFENFGNFLKTVNLLHFFFWQFRPLKKINWQILIIFVNFLQIQNVCFRQCYTSFWQLCTCSKCFEKKFLTFYNFRQPFPTFLVTFNILVNSPFFKLTFDNFNIFLQFSTSFGKCLV